MKSKRNLLICFIAACLCVLAFIVANFLLSRHNSTNQDQDVDAVALDYYNSLSKMNIGEQKYTFLLTIMHNSKLLLDFSVNINYSEIVRRIKF